MAAIGTRRNWSDRAIFAGLIVCLLVVRSLAPGCSAAFLADVAESLGRGASSTLIAACGAQKGDSVPTDEGRDHSACCILCGAGARDETPEFVAELALLPPIARPEPEAFAASVGDRVESEPPLGWASSWSSQAPPRV